MNEMASQVIGDAVSQLHVDLFIFERLPCLHGNLDFCHGRNTGGEDRTNELHAVAIYRDAEIVGHVPYNLAPTMSAFFYEREQSVCRNHRSQSQ